MADAGTWLEVPTHGDGFLVFDGHVVEAFGLSTVLRWHAHSVRVQISPPNRKGRRLVSIEGSSMRMPRTDWEVGTKHDADLRRLADALPDGTVTWK